MAAAQNRGSHPRLVAGDVGVWATLSATATTVDLNNGGTLDAQALTLKVTGTGANALTTDATRGLRVTVTEAAVAATASDTASAASGTWPAVLVDSAGQAHTGRAYSTSWGLAVPAGDGAAWTSSGTCPRTRRSSSTPPPPAPSGISRRRPSVAGSRTPRAAPRRTPGRCGT